MITYSSEATLVFSLEQRYLGEIHVDGLRTLYKGLQWEVL